MLSPALALLTVVGMCSSLEFAYLDFTHQDSDAMSEMAARGENLTSGKPDVDRTSGLADLRTTYRIGAGDVLQINVWKEPDASVPSAIVRPDGHIAMPLVKEVAVAGLTPAEVEHVIMGALKRYIPEADVTVVVS